MARVTARRQCDGDGGEKGVLYAHDVLMSVIVNTRMAYLRQPRWEFALVLSIGRPTEGGHEVGQAATSVPVPTPTWA